MNIQLNNYQTTALKTLCCSAGCDDKFEHKVAILISAIKDLSAAVDLTGLGLAWNEAFKDVYNELKLEEKNEAGFIHQLQVYSSLDAKKLIEKPSVSISFEKIKVIRAIRGLILLWHINEKKLIPVSLLTQLSKLFKGTNEEIKLLIKELTLDYQQLQILKDKYEPNDKWVKFISTVQVILKSEDKGPILKAPLDPIVSTINKSEVHTATTDNTTVQITTNDSVIKARTRQPIHQTGDLMKYNLSEMEFCSRKEFSGAPNLFEHFHPDELSELIPKVVKRYVETKDDVRLAYLLCLLTRCNISRFNFLRLNSDENIGVWIDVEQGYIVWSRNKLIKTDQNVGCNNLVRIPLPKEIAVDLQEKKSHLPNAASIGDLFNQNLQVLKKKVRSFSFENTLTSHRAFNTRLHFAYGRLVLQQCKDEVYAAAVSLDFSLGVVANFNYIVLEPDRINHICEEVYKKLGFLGEFVKPAIEPVGSFQGQQVDLIVEILNAQLNRAKQIYSEVNNKSSLNQLMVAHNQISFAVSLILAITCGLRRAMVYSIANHTIDLKNGLMLVQDKASTQYLTSRVVPIPSITEKWITFYKSWLKVLASRTSNKNKFLSLDLQTICSEKCELANIPLFFYFNRSKIKPIGSRHLQLLFKSTDLKLDLGRHFLDRVLRDSLGSVLLNAHAGRANLGQESFGIRSALPVVEALAMVKNKINEALSYFDIAHPPILNVQRYQTNHTITPYIPISWVKAENSKMSEGHGERCPNHQMTILNSTYFEKVLVYWTNSEFEPDFTQLAISLILIDGVIHQEEVFHALEQIAVGRIYLLENEYFVDVNTQKLGIRRINLSSITLCLAAKVDYLRIEFDKNLLLKSVNYTVKNLLKNVGLENQSLQNLLQMSEDFYAIRLAGPLKEWMCGRLHAKTLHPISLARHRLNMKEMLTDFGFLQQKSIKIKSDSTITAAITLACGESADRDGNSNDMRITKLSSKLRSMKEGFLYIADNLLNDYALFLSTSCPLIKSPSTVQKYFYVVKPLVIQVCSEIDDEEELATFDWTDAVTEFASKFNDESSLSSINYFLRMLQLPEIKSLKKDEARASRSYADQPSKNEVETAIRIIEMDESLSEYQKRSMLMLRLMNHLPLRAEDVAHLRICDIWLGDSSFIVLTNASSGTKKSKNGNRVLFITDSILIGKLGKLLDLRRGMVKKSYSEISLFGSSNDLESFEGTDELLDIVAKALRCATGAKTVRPHSLRGKYLTENVHHALMPLVGELDALRQRNVLYELTIEAGHADPDVSFKNYVKDLNVVRRAWVDKLIVNELSLSSFFISSISLVNYEAARKRLQRNFNVDDFRQASQLFMTNHFKSRLHDLSSDLVNGESKYQLNNSNLFQDSLLVTARYLTCCILGMPNEIAASFVSATPQLIEKINPTMSLFSAHKGGDFSSGLKIEYQRISESKAYVALGQHFGGWQIESTDAAQLLRILSLEVEKPWLIKQSELSFILNSIEPRMNNAGYVLKAFIPQCEEVETANKRALLFQAGVRRVEIISKRQFGSNGDLIVSFAPAKYQQQTYLEKKICNFEINTFLLSLLIYKN